MAYEERRQFEKQYSEIKKIRIALEAIANSLAEMVGDVGPTIGTDETEDDLPWESVEN